PVPLLKRQLLLFDRIGYWHTDYSSATFSDPSHEWGTPAWSADLQFLIERGVVFEPSTRLPNQFQGTEEFDRAWAELIGYGAALKEMNIKMDGFVNAFSGGASHRPHIAEAGRNLVETWTKLRSVLGGGFNKLHGIAGRVMAIAL